MARCLESRHRTSRINISMKDWDETDGDDDDPVDRQVRCAAGLVKNALAGDVGHGGPTLRTHSWLRQRRSPCHFSPR